MLTDEQIDAISNGLNGRQPLISIRERGRLIARAIEALVRAECVPQWQPIETAPRGSGMDGPDQCSHPDYVDPPRILLWTQEGMIVGYYDWYYHPGYGRGASEYESPWRNSDGGRAYGPTHWLPLPAAPGITTPQWEQQ